jgi:predicted DNA binding protein
VLEAAVDRGYFETPREVTLDELAADLDLPGSTVSYRLRRATAELAKSFVEHDA